MQKCPAASRRSHRTPTRGKKETAFRWGQTGMLSCVDTGHKPQLDSFLSLYFLRSSFSHHSPCSLQRYQRILSECVLGRSGTRRGYSLKIFCASSLWKGKKGTEKLNWTSSSSFFFRPLDTDCGDEEKKKEPNIHSRSAVNWTWQFSSESPDQHPPLWQQGQWQI